MEHNYRKNKDMFSTAMAVMAACMKRASEDLQFKERIADWDRDVEFSALAFRVYGMLVGGKYSESLVREHTLAVLDGEDIKRLPAPQDNDDSDCWLGVTCGEYLGYPTQNNFEIVEKALSEFANDLSVGYLSDIFDRHPEWISKVS